MKKLILILLVALALHILYFVVIAGIGITNTVLGRKAVWLELSFFLLLEILLFVVYFIAPLSSTVHKIVYWIVSELFSLFTAWFWMYFIAGPIWNF